MMLIPRRSFSTAPILRIPRTGANTACRQRSVSLFAAPRMTRSSHGAGPASKAATRNAVAAAAAGAATALKVKPAAVRIPRDRRGLRVPVEASSRPPIRVHREAGIPVLRAHRDHPRGRHPQRIRRAAVTPQAQAQAQANADCQIRWRSTISETPFRRLWSR